MGLIDCASGNSLWRGYDYHKENKVSKLIPIDDGIYEADVSGSGNEIYHVLSHAEDFFSPVNLF